MLLVRSKRNFFFFFSKIGPFALHPFSDNGLGTGDWDRVLYPPLARLFPLSLSLSLHARMHATPIYQSWNIDHGEIN